MGIPIPPEDFVIDPAKNYDVTLDTWFWAPGEPRCGGVYMGKHTCAKTGAQIIAWIDSESECTDNYLCGPPLAPHAQRLFSIKEI